jgi:hypothetical protein
MVLLLYSGQCLNYVLNLYTGFITTHTTILFNNLSNILWRACCRQYGMCWQPLLWQWINMQHWANETVAGQRMRAQQQHRKHHVTCFLCGLTPACYATMGRLRFLCGVPRQQWGQPCFLCGLFPGVEERNLLKGLTDRLVVGRKITLTLQVHGPWNQDLLTDWLSVVK